MPHVASLLAVTVALAGAAAGAAQAQALTPDQADVRCLMVLQFIARDPKQTDQAAKGILYYTGRISARGPISRVEATMKAEAPKMNAQAAQTELTRCTTELNARGKELQAVNQRLAAAARPAAAAPAKK